MNAPDVVYRFGPFELQPRERRLLCHGTPVSLPGKAFDLLVCLVVRAPRLVRKEEIFACVWPDTIVEETNLNYTVSIVRKCLQEGAAGGRWIETVPRQGYRFVADLERLHGAPGFAPPVKGAVVAPVPFVQREHEVAVLGAAFERVRAGRRQIVFVTGEAGIGKTSLVERFADAAKRAGEITIARGQCVDHRGEIEAYMPVLEALGRAGRQPHGAALVDALDRFAPSWLVQLPGLVGREQLAALRERLLGQTRERMLREIDEALVAATASAPLVLILEDLHWSDLSTIDLLSRLARSDEPARLMIVGTYRSADALAGSHPVHAMVQELTVRRACEQIALAPLSRSGVESYLDERFGGAIPAAVVDLVSRRTEGNPLFVAALVESWCAGGVIASEGSGPVWRGGAAAQAPAPPASLRAFLEEQVRRLPNVERDVLEAAAVVGFDFPAVLVASALERPVEEVEAVCARLARIGQFVRAAGQVEFPDGTVSDRCEFVHAFYVEVLYELLPAGRRVRLHQQIALAMEALHGEHASDVAAHLAPHFVAARDARKAVRYLQLAAGQAMTRSAPREAVGPLEQARRMVPRIADPGERVEHELSIEAMLAMALTATRGFCDVAAETAYRRAYDLARSLDTPRVFPIAFGLATMLELRGQYRDSQRIMEEHLPGQDACGGYVTEARDLLACSLYHQGVFETALQHALEGLEGVHATSHSALTDGFGEHPGIGCCTWAALSLWFLGRPDEALQYARRAVALAEAPGYVYSLANARAQLACLHQLRREPADALRWAGLTTELGERQGFLHRGAIGQVVHGWARGAQGDTAGGIEELERGLEGTRRIGMQLDGPYFLALLAEILTVDRQFDRALAAIAAAQGQLASSRSFFYEAELWRLRGSILLTARGPEVSEEADDCFTRAIEVATHQGARILLMRALLARARLGHGAAAAPDSVIQLASLYGTFTEGLETPDLLETAQFLAAPAR